MSKVTGLKKLKNGIMRTYIDCMPCFIRQALEAVRHATDDAAVHEAVLRRVMELAGKMDMGQSPPVIGQQIHRWVRDFSGQPDPYRKVKQRFNELALALYPELRERVNCADDPLETAVRLAIAGNIIDFGVFGSMEPAKLHQTIDECLSANFDVAALEEFRQAVQLAERILYLADNAGEIVFDRLLIEQLPAEKVRVAVKGSPIINDATMTDADAVGLPSLVEVIDNGSDAPGTLLKSCSEHFRYIFENADLIIAKGQGNYETLSDVDKPIYFLLQVKCPVIADHLERDIGQMMFHKSDVLTDKQFSVTENL